MIDHYTRTMLTVIAIALCVIAFRGMSPIPVAHAADTLDCRLSSPVELRNAQVRLTDTVSVKIESFGMPGYSSSSPLYIKQVN